MTRRISRFSFFPGMLVLLLVPATGCLEAPPRSEVDTARDSLGGQTATGAPARYLTHFVFAGVDGSAFFGRFEQTTSERQLARVYDAWWSGPEGWRQLTAVRDTLPVPRAAWRILPSDGMNVRVGDSREVVGLSFTTSGGRVELRTGDEVALLTGPTGQRESVGVAGLEVDGESVGGLLFFRRAARALQFPDAAGSSRGFLLADSVGNGLLIETTENDSSAVAHTWLHGSVDAWSDVVLVTDTLAGTAPGRRWRFDIPDAALSGTIRAVASPSEGPVPAFRVVCELIADGDVFRFTGLAASLPLP
ncbi:MAG: hypothetical protein OEU54_03360 [Gemmatimonadota bacterium]|nr:hypothetical protein [Gemmatimonadota bacterium]